MVLGVRVVITSGKAGIRKDFQGVVDPLILNLGSVAQVDLPCENSPSCTHKICILFPMLNLNTRFTWKKGVCELWRHIAGFLW